MKTKSIFLFLLLLLPIIIVCLLYLLGKNRYDVQNPKYLGQKLNPGGLATGQPTLVAYQTRPLSDIDCLFADRLLNRLGRVANHGPFRLLLLSSESEPLNPCRLAPEQTHFIKTLPQTAGQVAETVRRIHRLNPDSMPPLYLMALTDARGNVRNAYDLRREEMIDSVVIESLILVENP